MRRFGGGGTSEDDEDEGTASSATSTSTSTDAPDRRRESLRERLGGRTSRSTSDSNQQQTTSEETETTRDETASDSVGADLDEDSTEPQSQQAVEDRRIDVQQGAQAAAEQTQRSRAERATAERVRDRTESPVDSRDRVDDATQRQDAIGRQARDLRERVLEQTNVDPGNVEGARASDLVRVERDGDTLQTQLTDRGRRAVTRQQVVEDRGYAPDEFELQERGEGFVVETTDTYDRRLRQEINEAPGADVRDPTEQEESIPDAAFSMRRLETAGGDVSAPEDAGPDRDATIEIAPRPTADDQEQVPDSDDQPPITDLDADQRRQLAAGDTDEASQSGESDRIEASDVRTAALSTVAPALAGVQAVRGFHDSGRVGSFVDEDTRHGLRLAGSAATLPGQMVTETAAKIDDRLRERGSPRDYQATVVERGIRGLLGDPGAGVRERGSGLKAILQEDIAASPDDIKDASSDVATDMAAEADPRREGPIQEVTQELDVKGGPPPGFGLIGPGKTVKGATGYLSALRGSQIARGSTRTGPTGSQVAESIGRQGEFAARGVGNLVRKAGIATSASALGIEGFQETEIDAPTDRSEFTQEEIKTPEEQGSRSEIQQPENPEVGDSEVEVSEEPRPSEVDTPESTDQRDPELIQTAQVTVAEEELEEEEEIVISEEEIREVDDREGDLAREQYEQTQYEIEEEYGEEIQEDVDTDIDDFEPREFDDIDDGLAGEGDPELAEGEGTFFGNFQDVAESELEDDIVRRRQELVGRVGETEVSEEAVQQELERRERAMATLVGVGSDTLASQSVRTGLLPQPGGVSPGFVGVDDRLDNDSREKLRESEDSEVREDADVEQGVEERTPSETTPGAENVGAIAESMMAEEDVLSEQITNEQIVNENQIADDYIERLNHSRRGERNRSGRIPWYPLFGGSGSDGSVSGRSSGPGRQTDSPLTPGWLEETVTTIAVGGTEPARSPSQSELEEQPIGAQLTGGLPTAQMLSDDEETRERIEEVESLLGGFQFDDEGGGIL